MFDMEEEALGSVPLGEGTEIKLTAVGISPVIPMFPN